MMRVLEFIVALVIVAVLGVVAAVVMPSSGHVERSLSVSKDLRQVYDLLDNFGRLPQYSVLRSEDRNLQFSFSGPAYGPGASISWTSTNPKIGNGGLTIASAKPGFEKIDSNTQKAEIVWNVDNQWRGQDKHFTLDLKRDGSRGQLTNITWAYDVSYGWNLVNRFANLYIHGDPDSFIQFGLNNLQNILATVPNVDYTQLFPTIEKTQPTPVLLVSSKVARKGGDAGITEATDKIKTQIQAVAKKLKVNITGPAIFYITNFGDQNIDFDLALPIDSSTLTINGQDEQLTAATAPALGADSQPAEAQSAPAEAGSAPASASSSAKPAYTGPAPGSRDERGRLVVDGNVRAELAFGGLALRGIWIGNFNGVPQTGNMLKAYADTHGYQFDDVVKPMYDIVITPEVQNDKGEITSYAHHAVFLPLTKAPQQTPEQKAGLHQPEPDNADMPATAGSAPAGASSTAPALSSSAAEPASAKSAGN